MLLKIMMKSSVQPPNTLVESFGNCRISLTGIWRRTNLRETMRVSTVLSRSCIEETVTDRGLPFHAMSLSQLRLFATKLSFDIHVELRIFSVVFRRMYSNAAPVFGTKGFILWAPTKESVAFKVIPAPLETQWSSSTVVLQSECIPHNFS
jgi:hypothetical protein